jgi:hypothetical protein
MLAHQRFGDQQIHTYDHLIGCIWCKTPQDFKVCIHELKLMEEFSRASFGAIFLILAKCHTPSSPRDNATEGSKDYLSNTSITQSTSL